MAITRREIVKELTGQGVPEKEAEAQATKILATQGDIVTVNKQGKIRPVDPGPSIFDSPE